MGLHLRCMKMNQNAPRCTKKVNIARQTKKFWICPQWVIWLCTWGSPKQETFTEKVLTIQYIFKSDGAFWCSSCTTPWPTICSDFYPLLSVCLIQKLIIFFTKDNFQTLCSLLQWWAFWCTLVHIGAFWCTSCATPSWLAWTPIPFQMSI